MAYMILICAAHYRIKANSSNIISSFENLQTFKNSTTFNEKINIFLENYRSSIDYAEPKITIVTPGANSDLKTWGMHNAVQKLYFNDNSIVSFLSRRGAQIYPVSFLYKNNDNEIIENLLLEHLKYTNITDSYITNSFLDDLHYNSPLIDDFEIQSLDEPIIIVFSPNFENDGHKIYNYDGTTFSKLSSNVENAYTELEKMTNYIIFHYMEMDYEAHKNDHGFTLTIPRINMIGHSRGGIINMQYAIEHPDIVDSLYSIGTPYNGSMIYNAFGNNNNNNIFNLLFGSDNNTIALQDCVGSSSYLALKHYWNLYQSSPGYGHTKLYAIAGTMGLDYFRDFIYHAEQSNNFFINIFKWLYVNNMFSISHKSVPYDILSTQFPDLLEDDGPIYHVNNYYYSFDTNDVVYTANGKKNLNSLVNQTIGNTTLTIDMVRVIAGMLNQMVYNLEAEEYVMKNDIFFECSSQQAEGYENVIRFEKVFTKNNYDLNARSFDNQPAVVHNLEACDEDIINCILSNIVLGNNDNGFNIKKIDEDTYEYIGFSYKKAVKNKVLTINPYMGEAEYHLSKKMFDCYYIQAQKRFKNRYDNAYMEINSTNNDGINEIKLNTNIKASQDTFAFLKGNVRFNLNSHTMTNTSSLFENYFLVFGGSLYTSSFKLIKYGGNISDTDITINDVKEIYKGAFIGQVVQKLSFTNLNQNYETLEIGDYAFYGCDRLNEISTAIAINNVNQNAFIGTNCYETNDTFILNNLLVKAGSDSNIIDTNSPITKIATGAFGPEYDSNYLVIKKSLVFFNNKAIQSNNIENIFLYSSLISISMSSFDSAFFTDTYPDIYTSYHNYDNIYDSSVLNGSVLDTITISFDLPGYQNSWPVASFNQNNIIALSSLNLSNYNGYQITGFYEPNNDHHCYISNLQDTFNLYCDAGKTFELYYSCGNHLLTENNYDNTQYHNLLCENCKYKTKENHDFAHQAVNSSTIHNATCSCGYSTYLNHNYVYNGNNTIDTHELMCSDCGYLRTDIHIYERRIIDYLGSLYEADICIMCGHLELYNIVTVTDDGATHTFSNGVTSPHTYETIIYNNYAILVCTYCNHHIHNGIMGVVSNYSGHEKTCAYCNETYIETHTYTNYTNQLSDLEDGYHSATCIECGYLLEAEHQYYEDIAYMDGHHYKCILCHSTAVFVHTDVHGSDSTQNYHTNYCNVCGCYYAVAHQNIIVIDDIGHHIECSICHYVNASDNHTLVCNCESNNPHEHYKYCLYCAYTESTDLEYMTYHEYEHYCKCTECNLQIVETHEEHCIYYDDEWHTYMCYCCSVNYLMPHFVNNHLIIYENYEPGYDLWVCTYCGYMEVRRRE